MPLVFFSVLADAAENAQAYLCIPDTSVGISFNKVTKHWEPTTFALASKKYLVKKVAKGWTWADFRSPALTSPCPDFNKSGIMVCDAFPQQIFFNRDNSRFQTFYYAGYISYLGEEGGDTPNMEIGTCAPL